MIGFLGEHLPILRLLTEGCGCVYTRARWQLVINLRRLPSRSPNEGSTCVLPPPLIGHTRRALLVLPESIFQPGPLSIENQLMSASPRRHRTNGRVFGEICMAQSPLMARGEQS
jgi:hypothetical protein